MLKLFRLVRTLRILRVVKLARYSKGVERIKNVFVKQKQALIAVTIVAAFYIFIAVLMAFIVELTVFDNFFEVIYWAAVSLTTVGCGDIYPVTTIGRALTIVSSFFGIAIVALPAGMITAGYLDELRREEKEEKENE